MPLVSVEGVAIAYDVAGDGPPVVFVHGLTSVRQSWDPVTDVLREDFTCVRVDLRGHGASSEAPDYSMLSLVGDVRAVVEELELANPAIVGHSLGATVAAVYAAWLTGLVPDALVEVWDGSGHMLHLVEPDRFAARLRPLLAEPAR